MVAPRVCMTIVFEKVRSVTPGIRWLPSGLHGFAAGRRPSRCKFEPLGEPNAAARHRPRPADDVTPRSSIIRIALRLSLGRLALFARLLRDL